MRANQFQTPRLRCLVVVLLSLAPGPTATGAAAKLPGKDTVRKAITRIAGLALKKGDVEVREVRAAGTGVEVAATVRTAFCFRQGAAGRWQAAEVRVGDRQWEDLELLARAWQLDPADSFLTGLETAAAQLSGQQRERSAAAQQRQQQAALVEITTRPGHKRRPEPPPPPPEVRAGPVLLKEFSALLSAATVVARIDMSFRLERARGRWQVVAARIGAGPWADVPALVGALDAAKVTRARADLATLAAALEAFRRARGFYVVGASAAGLTDQLNPRYTPAIIRLDPWHRPYEYEGTPARYTLRSRGPDGKADTADDVTISSAGH